MQYFSEKIIILYFIIIFLKKKTKKSKNQTLNWLAGHPVYGAGGGCESLGGVFDLCFLV
jgi:hypothetical protein